jgi:hypothetical protein
MKDDSSAKWLVEIFLQYQESIDSRRKGGNERQWLKDALESDRECKPTGFDSASRLDSF